MKYLVGVLALVFSLTSAAAEIVTQNNVTVKRIGSHPGNRFFISLAEGFTKPCKWGLAYCSLSEPSCNSMLSIALVAKSTGTVMPDFRYQYNSETQACSVWLVTTQ